MTVDWHDSSERGQGMIEYSMLVAMFTIVVVLGFTFLGPRINALFSGTVDGETAVAGRAQVSNAVGNIPCADQVVGGDGSGGTGSGSGSGSGSGITCEEGVGGSGSGGNGSGNGGGSGTSP